MLHVAVLGSACPAVKGHAAASTAQTVGAADDDDLAALPLQHLRQDSACQPMQRVVKALHPVLHFLVALFMSRRVFMRIGKVGDENIDMPDLSNEVVCSAGNRKIPV